MEVQVLAEYGWVGISVVLGGVIAYLYKRSRDDQQALRDLYEKWIASNAATDARIDKLISDYSQLLVKMSNVMQRATDALPPMTDDNRRQGL